MARQSVSLDRAMRMPDLRRMGYFAQVALMSFRHDGIDFLSFWPVAHRCIPGWLTIRDARLLYAMAHHGPGNGAIVEIGSAWGKSTVALGRGAKRARREPVHAIDPHTGDPWYLDQTGLAREQFSSLAGFQANIRRFQVEDWVIPVVSTSADAATSLDTGPIRLLYIDGLHTYEGIRCDIEAWVPHVVPGGLIVFDDYSNINPGVGVRAAVDELLSSGLVEPRLRVGELLTWTRRR
jgi:hypothetical protein